MDNVLAPQPTDVNRGNSVLGRIFGSKDVSRTVAQQASSNSGLDPETLKKMLPMLAMLVAGYLARQRAGGAGDAPPSFPSARASAGPSAGAAGGSLGALIGGLLSARGAASASPSPSAGPSRGLLGLLDLSGDGNPLDDILRMAGKQMRK
jgi:hypothetical protein